MSGSRGGAGEAAGAVASRPDLTPRQERAILDAACEYVRAAAEGRPPSIADPGLAGAASLVVAGAFVTVQREGRLRSCCGLLGDPVTIGEAVERAAASTATNDPRFPPVSPAEVDLLDYDVSLLYSLQAVRARGEERIRSVVPGTHGVQVIQGWARGVFLPVVAAHFDFDARKFLEQVCLKAGLPPSAWIDERTSLYTFEAVVLERAARR